MITIFNKSGNPIRTAGRAVTKEDISKFNDLMNGFLGKEYIPFFCQEHQSLGSEKSQYYCIGKSRESGQIVGIYEICFDLFPENKIKHHPDGIRKIYHDKEMATIQILSEDDKKTFQRQYAVCLGSTPIPLFNVVSINNHILHFFVESTLSTYPTYYQVNLLANTDRNLLSPQTRGFNAWIKTTNTEVALSLRAYEEDSRPKIDAHSIEPLLFSKQEINGTKYHFVLNEYNGLAYCCSSIQTFDLSANNIISDVSYVKF